MQLVAIAVVHMAPGDATTSAFQLLRHIPNSAGSPAGDPCFQAVAAAAAAASCSRQAKPCPHTSASGASAPAASAGSRDRRCETGGATHGCVGGHGIRFRRKDRWG